MIWQQPLRIESVTGDEHLRINLVAEILHLGGISMAKVIFGEKGNVLELGPGENAHQVLIGRIKFTNGNAVCV